MSTRRAGRRATQMAALMALLAFGPALPAREAAPGVDARQGGEPSASPHAGENFPRRVYWGDTHLHSSYSFDAYPFGNESVGPREAYRFARGEEITSAGRGLPVRLRRPLDWLVLTDHAEYLGMTRALFQGHEGLLQDADAAAVYELVREGRRIEAVMMIGNSIARREELFGEEGIKTDIWKRLVAIADAHHTPGQFSALIGFEWTSMPGTGDNLHRVVVFRDGGERAGAMLPFSVFDSEDPEDLWRWMARYEEATGGQVLAIPHNGNTSNGRMFSDRTLGGQPLDRAYAVERSHWEPLYEVTQIKGDGETHPKLSPRDAFADFETWDRGNITANTPKQDWMLRHEYARSGLLLGLGFESELGANPYKFGLVGSTDAHTGLSTADDDNFWGKMSTGEPGPGRLEGRVYGGKAFDLPTRITSASGYAGVWATANTRAALFDAMRRREVYATTGPRITVRFFGGWHFQAGHASAPDPAATAYRLGVPMGGDLPPRPAGRSPGFLVTALMDPDGAMLDRVQIIKGWRDAVGRQRERVFEVAWSGAREPGADGMLPAIGNTVDTRTATYSNTIGAARLATVWADPDFDPAERAFYYARVLEIPTPRWSTHDAARFGVPLPADVPASIQQRAYTSPIWYAPLPSDR